MFRVQQDTLPTKGVKDMCSLNEILFTTAITVIGILSVTGILYLIFDKTLTYKLWVGLAPGSSHLRFVYIYGGTSVCTTFWLLPLYF